MKLYERGTVWYMDFTAGGKRYQKSTGRPLADKAGAQRVLQDAYKKAMDRHQFGDKDEITVADAFAAKLKTIHTTATWKQYNVMRRKWIGEDDWANFWHLPNGIKVSELRQIHLDDHRDARISEGRKPNSINAEIRILRLVVNWAKKRYVGPRDELDFALLPRFVKTRYFSENEMAEIWRIFDENCAKEEAGGTWHRAKSLALFLRNTGMRVSEALEVDWSELDLTNGVAEFWREKTDEVSAVPLPQEVIDDLKRRHNDPMPFMRMDWPIKKLRAVLDQVGNKNPKMVRTRGRATIHTLRDTYATELLNEGMSLHQLASLLGHTTEGMTAKYAHVRSSKLLEQTRDILERRRAS